MICTVTLANNGDEVRWRWSHVEAFTVKSLYTFLQDSGVTETKLVPIWKIKIPLKVKFFCWLVVRRKVLMKDNLLKRGWLGADTCDLCLDESENVNHLLL